MSVSAYQFYNSCQPPLTSLSSSFLFYVLTQHQKSYFPAAKGSFTLQAEQKVPLLEGIWPYPRSSHVWHEPLQPLTPCTFGIWQSGTSKYACFHMCTYIYIYIYKIYIYTNLVPTNKQTNIKKPQNQPTKAKQTKKKPRKKPRTKHEPTLKTKLPKPSPQ